MKRWTFEEDVFYRSLYATMLADGMFDQLGLDTLKKKCKWLIDKAVEEGHPERSVKSVQTRRCLYLTKNLQEIHNLTLEQTISKGTVELAKVKNYYYSQLVRRVLNMKTFLGRCQACNAMYDIRNNACTNCGQLRVKDPRDSHA